MFVTWSTPSYLFCVVVSLLEKDFHAAANRYLDLKGRVGKTDELNIYALYKQATVGDCNVVKPSGLIKKKLLKYLAWKARIGLSTEEAAIRYIEEVKRLDDALFKKYHRNQAASQNSRNGSKGSLVAAGTSAPGNSKPVIRPAKSQQGQARRRGNEDRDRDREHIADQHSNIGSMNGGSIPGMLMLNVPPPEQRYTRARASVHFNQILAGNLKSQLEGKVFQESHGGEDYLDEEDIFPEHPNPLKKTSLPSQQYSQMSSSHVLAIKGGETKSSLVILPASASNRDTIRTARTSIRERFKVTEAEYKRFTLMKINSVNLESRYPSRGESYLSFTKPQYAYRGPTLNQLISQGKRAKDPFGSKSNLTGIKKGKKEYMDVLPMVHHLSTEYMKDLTGHRMSNDKFDVKVIPKIELDLFIFRLIRYLDKWFEDPPGINSVGCRSTLITKIYIQRLQKNMDDFGLSKYNIHKLLSVCMLLAAKFCEDCIIANSYWAQVAGIPMNELNKVEELFCGVTHFDLYVTEPEIAEMYALYDMQRL